jgi:hypothetical protein
MDVFSIQGLMENLQAHEKRVDKIQDDVGVQAFFFKARWFWTFIRGKGHG